jgi:hypothetical protein
MTDLSNTIIAKSDQLNADDLISGPITITITKVSAGSAEQPIAISYEGDNGKPYKPSKGMRRVMVAAWGRDGQAYVGRSMTLFREPGVKWAGEPVGGIRISHMSHISGELAQPLTLAKGIKKQYTVKPLSVVAPAPVDEKLLQSLLASGEQESAAGLAAYEAWFKGLTKDERRLAAAEKVGA